METHFRHIRKKNVKKWEKNWHEKLELWQKAKIMKY